MCLQSLQQDIEVNVSLKLWVTLLIIWSELMQPISWCVYCHSSCGFVVVFSVFTVAECVSFCTKQSSLLHFFFFFCTRLSWMDQSSVVIKPSQGAGWWWSVLADFFCCSEAISCFGSELLCRRYKQLVIWMLIFNVDCEGVWWSVVVCKPGRYYQENYPPNVLLIMLKQN